MISKKIPVILFLISISVSACMMPQIVTTYQARNDLILKDSWKDFLTKNPNPKVVLRVPDSPKDITQSEMMTYNSLYSHIEKSMLEANFTVRDRSLLKEVLNRAGGELNYADIGKKIDTDVIVEIVNVKIGTWMQGTVSSDSQGAPDSEAGRRQAESDLKSQSLRKGRSVRPAGGDRSNSEVFGAIVEGRIIMVATGDIVGMFTLKEVHPYPEEWIKAGANGQSIRIASEDLTESDIEYLRTNITQKLVNFLKGQPVPDSVVSSTGYGAAYGKGSSSGVKR